MAFVLIVVFFLLVLVRVLRGTRFAWLPGVLVIAGAVAVFGMMEPVEDDMVGMGALANGMLTLASLGLGIFGVILLCVGANKSGKRSPQEPTLPVATAIATGDERPSAGR